MNLFRNNSFLILFFALLHALVAFLCRLAGIGDDIMLTLLSMLLVVVICLNRQMDVRFLAVWVVLANAFGFVLGMGTSKLLFLLCSSKLVVYPLSTFLSTLVLGECVDGSCRLLGSRFGQKTSTTDRNIKWLLIAFVLILAFRFVMMLFRSTESAHVTTLNILVDYLFSCVAIVVVAQYATDSAARAEKEREKANLAQYRYLMLKQQVNPHFLFNSLNILDCLVQEQKNEQASEYVHKLADIYRYLLHNEEEKLVSLSEEMDFVGKYVDLLKVRFGEGFSVDVRIPDEVFSMRVVPFSIQVLIENAMKHNAVSTSDPLKVLITSCGDGISVENNLRPKISSTAGHSTGLGLKYIRRQYEDISGREIRIEQTDTIFRTTIPLL